ncbi:MAG: hypothetical protein RL141_431 [Candidatus Parcubacteria bacterium]
MTIPTVFVSPGMAMAATITNGAWGWTDISNQLTVRTNRPLWAVSHANGAWFYTDGQNLWNGGQAYRYDGFTQVNITSELRNAGIDRVDDIVSDGNTVLFLQDVVRLDNQLRVVEYGSLGHDDVSATYRNRTAKFRGALQSDEGVSSVTGQNGTWYVVTTNARMFRLTDSGSATQITLPNGIQGNIESTPMMLRYNTNRGSANNGAGRIALTVSPIGGNAWLVVADAWNAPVRFYRFDGSTFTDITSFYPTTDAVTKVVSNGTTGLILATGPNGQWTRLTNGSTSADVFGIPSVFNQTRIGWNGKSWMVLQGKQAYRVSNTLNSQTAESYGRMADLFLQAAGDNNGRLLLVGAKSETWLEDPSAPLTAKLVMVTEGVAAPQVLGISDTITDNVLTVGGNFGGDRVHTSSNGPRLVTQGNPADFRIGNGKEFAYRATASDNGGVDRVDLYVNDARIKTCFTTVCEFRSIFWTSGATARSVKFWARAFDRQGNTTDNAGNPSWLTVDTYSTASAGGTVSTTPGGTVAGTADTAGSIWTWTDPNTTTLSNNQSISFNATAQDANGLARIEIIANGSTVRTCELGNATGNQTCSTSLFAGNYTQGTNIFVNAKATDRLGNTTWSTGTTLFRANDVVMPPPTSGNGANPSVWEWLQPAVSTLSGSEGTDYHASAWDADGLSRIEIVVNGTQRRTCEFGGALNTQDCVYRLNASNFPTGTDVFVNAKATDRFGNVAWTNGTTVRIPAVNTPTTPSTPTPSPVPTPNGNLSISANQSTFRVNDRLTFTTTGSDPDGIDRVEIYINGVRNKTCYNTASCTLVAGPWNNRQSITYSATIYDRQGRATVTGYKEIYRVQ